MTSRITQPVDAIDPCDAAEQAGQRPRPSVRAFAMIGINVLSDQRDFAYAGFGQAFDFDENFLHRPRHFHAACVGYDAERAELVATFLHRDEGGYATRTDDRYARRGEMIEFVVGRKLGIDGFAVARRACQQIRQAVITLRAKDQINRWSTADDLLALGLRDAAGNGDDDASPRGGGRFLYAA